MISTRLALLLPLLAALLAAPRAARATPEYLETFLKAYEASGKLKDVGCAICHTTVPRHNGYGKALNDALVRRGVADIDAALMRSVEKDDSDGDGATNGEEIRAATLPGDAKSAPAKRVSNASTSSQPPEPARGASPLVASLPKHAFHPQLVHFPLALFLFGGALDLLGMARRRSDVRRAGIWNMTAGAIATALAIPTGFFAASLSGYPLEVGSAATIHLLYAVGATLLMVAVVAWRARREPTGPAYVALLVLTALLLGWAGHLGGGLVYG